MPRACRGVDSRPFCFQVTTLGRLFARSASVTEQYNLEFGTGLIFTNFLSTVYYVRGSVLLWRRCDTLCSSGLMDDIMFYPMTGNRRRNSDSVGSNMDLPPWCILKLTHQGFAALYCTSF